MTIYEVESEVMTLDPTLDPSARIAQRGLELSEALGALIAEERKARKWSQTQLADKLGMRQSTLATYESGSRQLGHLHVHIIEALGVALEMPRGSILERLGLVEREIDFITFVMSRPELDKRMQMAFCDLYVLFTEKGELPEG